MTCKVEVWYSCAAGWPNPERLMGREALAGLKVGERGRALYRYRSAILKCALDYDKDVRGILKVNICSQKVGRGLEASSRRNARVSSHQK